jgi:thioredoxin reductase (NADPH)
MDKTGKNYDVIIIGGGVAGLSAALWCEELKLSALLLEKENEFGGQLLRVYNPIENHLGVAAKNGKHLRDIFLGQIEKRKFTRLLQTEVAEVDVENKKIILQNADEFSAKAIIIATGVRRRKLNIENEDFYKGKGIIESGKNEQNTVKGKSVLIVGGGDAAIENSLILSETAKKVYVAHRRNEFRAREEFLEQSRNNPKIEFLTDTIVQKIIGKQKIEAVETKNTKTGKETKLKVENLLIRIGVEPNSELFQKQLKTDKNGYLEANARCETDVKFVFAVGDIANPISPTVSTAVGTGATVAKTILSLLNS